MILVGEGYGTSNIPEPNDEQPYNGLSHSDAIFIIIKSKKLFPLQNCHSENEEGLFLRVVGLGHNWRCSRLTPDSSSREVLRGPYGMWRIEPGLAACKASTLTTVIP